MKQYRINKNKFYLGASDFIDDWNIYYNMMALPSKLLIQYETPMMNFFRYVSFKEKNVTSEEEFARQFIQSFKKGTVEDAAWAALIVAKYLKRHRICGKKYTFLCVPASSSIKHDKRYSYFMSEVCRLTKMNNGYGLVNVSSSRKPVHEGGRRDLINYSIDESISGHKVVLFDDVYTTGNSWTTFASHLEDMNADVVQGIFLAEASSTRLKID